jgi:hypothetical protein
VSSVVIKAPRRWAVTLKRVWWEQYSNWVGTRSLGWDKWVRENNQVGNT